jgi:hypothetical protein
MTETEALNEPQDQIGANSPDVPEIPERPDHVPEKFWDPKTGQVRVEALLKSYRDLERRFVARIRGGDPKEGDIDPDRDVLFGMLGRPDSPDEYCVNCDHGYFEPDDDLHARFHALGMTNDQVQAVYDAARDRLVPMILDLAADQGAEREMDRVVDYFGGPEKWAVVARQLLAYGRKYLPPETLAHLSSSFDGIKMLADLARRQTGDPGSIGLGRARDDLGEDQLQKLMRDPRYWRDHDPKFMAKVQEGFERLYG